MFTFITIKKLCLKNRSLFHRLKSRSKNFDLILLVYYFLSSKISKILIMTEVREILSAAKYEKFTANVYIFILTYLV